MMRKYFLVILTTILLFSCDDGDLIVTDFNFEERSLQWCTGNNNMQVFYKINNTTTNEAIALIFRLEPASENFLIAEEGVLEIPVSAQNEVVYRTFNSAVGENYFCREIPPVSPVVNEEYRSTSKGLIRITSTLRNAEDHDADGVPSLAEGMETQQDTDNDGIPDYLDIDDDNDNIRTSGEIAVDTESTAMGYPDSDGDGIPNYLDPDDDNDNALTRNEDWNQSGSPLDDVNDEGIPYYLLPEISDSFEVTTFITNTISRRYRYQVNIYDLTLVRQGEDGEQIRMENFDLGFFDSAAQNVTYPLEGETEEE